MNLADWLTEASEASRKSLVFMTGESGVGKTYLADQLAIKTKTQFLDLDSFGETVDVDGRDRWIINTDELYRYLDAHSEVGIVCGTSDNLADVLKTLAPKWFLSVYYVQATPGLFRKIQAKKRDEAIRNRLSDDWIRGWANKARMTDEKVNQMFGDSSWSYMCSVAFGFAQARELNGGDVSWFMVKSDKPSLSFKAWADALKPKRDVILERLKESVLHLGTVMNDATSEVQIASGWHKSQRQVKPKISTK